MATLDSLAGDQRAVLQLVLVRGRGYEEIGRLLSISPESVRERALAALDALGPATELDAEVRQTICDYLLRQLDDDEAGHAHDLLELSPPARTWARAVGAQLAPVAAQPLPAIPQDGAAGPAAVVDDDPDEAPDEAPSGEPAGAAARPPSSRRGGMVVIAIAALVVIAVVIVLVVHHGHHHPHANVASTPPSTTSSTSTSSTTASAHPVAQINLFSTTKGSKAVAAAEVVQEGSVRAVAIVGQHIPPNSKHNSYEVWLYSSPTQFEKLGFVSPAVGRSGRFSDEAELPADAGRYKELIVTTETASKPTRPGPILLRGTISGLS